MKILIIGEFSGFSKYLSLGLRALGHKPFVFSWGDSFKRIVNDGDSYLIDVYNCKIGKFPIKGSNRIKRLVVAPRLHRFIAKMPKDWDCCLIINTGYLRQNKNVFSDKIAIGEVASLLKEKKQIYLMACGGDPVFDMYYPRRKKVCPSYLIKSQINLTKAYKDGTYEAVLPLIKGIIPITTDYTDAYSFYQTKYKYKLYPIIPLPFDVENCAACNEINEKIVIMHGINRYYEKGSDYIIPAMSRIKEDFPKEVELKIVSHVTLEEYLKIMKEANVVIDQAYAQSAGMNAVEALAMGKVVLGGNQEGNAESLGVESFPVIDIGANVDQIYNVLRKLVLSRDLIHKISLESRKTAEDLYECKKVAQKYVDIFMGVES